MTSYSKYKDSEIEWIGEIPVHWEVIKLKYVSDTKPSNVDKKTKEGESAVLLCNYTDVYNNDFITSKLTFMKASASDAQIEKFTLNVDDVILTKDSEDPTDIAIPALVSEKIDNLVCGYHLTLVKPEKEFLNGKYLFRLFESNDFNISFQLEANGITRFGIGSESFTNVPILLPSPQEQTQIANFLDQKTTELDTSIEQLEQLIRLLQEERIGLINEAVTKGINPDVPMKDTGIEWADKIPTHWKIVKLRYLADITTGDKDTENREDDGIYPFFVRSQKIEKISTYSYDGEAILTAGDGVGVCKVWHYINDKFDFHQRVYMMHNFKDVVGKFLYHFMKSNFIYEVLKLSAKSTVDSLRRPMFLDFPVIVPPLSEQQQIVQHIATQTNRIDTEIKYTQQEIELLKEYKQSLITEAVTGKIDVRKHALTT